MPPVAKTAACMSIFVALSFSPSFSGCAPAPDGIGNICGPNVVDTASMPPLSTGSWIITTDTSPMDDSKAVFATLRSKNMVPSRYGSSSRQAEITMRCLENTTAVIFTMNDQFLADIQGYGVIEYRIDDRKATKVNGEESTDNRALGLWSGKRAIPFIKGLFEGQRLIVRITPFNESSFTMEFDIRGAEAASKELREACGW